MEKKKVVVIGAGVGGLVCANKLAKAGLDVLLLEQHSKVGGYGQCWSRRFKLSDDTKGVAKFEVTHATTGFGEGGGHHKLYTELGADWDVIGPFSAAPKFAAFRTADGKKLEVLNGFEDNKENLLKSFPDDAEGINKFFGILDRVYEQSRPLHQRSGWKKTVEEKFGRVASTNLLLTVMLYSLTKPTLVARRNHTFQQYLDECFQNDDIKTLLSTLFGYIGLPPSRASGTLMSLMLLDYWKNGGAQAPAKNSYQAMHDELGHALERNGGKLQLRSDVTKIDVKDGKVLGVEVNGKDYVKADYVVLAGDAKRGLLPLKKHLPKRYTKKLEEMVMSVSFMSAHAVLEMDLSGMVDELGYAANVLASSPDSIETFGRNFPEQYLIYASVPTVLRPDAGLVTDLDGKPLKDCHILDLVMLDPKLFEYWDNLRKENRKQYIAEKNAYAEQMLDIAERTLIPGLRDAVRFMDVSTSKTYERYCKTTDGAVYTFECTPKQFVPNRPGAKTPIEGLYLTGSAILSAGIGGAVSSGEMTAEAMLKDIKK